jgi:Secretion system C-terminal sorting domain
MKKISTLLITFFVLINAHKAAAQKTYTINSSGNWSTDLPSTCANCTINISSGSTLTIDEAATCQNCIFSGGALSMNNESLNIQYTGGSPVTTYFDGTNFLITGTGSVIVNAPLSLTNSTFSFNNSSSFKTSYEVDLTGSVIKLNDKSSMVSTGASTTPIKLMNSSQIIIGNGSSTSTASFLVSGPSLMIYDNSSVVVGNDNNVYNNWAGYTTAPGATSGTSAQTSWSTNNNTLNCGGQYPNKCANPSVFGPATLSSAGTTGANTLPVVLVGFTAILNSDRSVALTWNTEMEVNSSHFDIERSADGTVWNSIGMVAAAGNSSTETTYSYTDASPLPGTNYYRLKMVDLDNNYGYTNITVIRMTGVNNISFFPNPARDFVNISLGETAGSDVTIRLINQSGQVLQEKRVQGGNGTIVSLPLLQYAAGLYILSVSQNDGSRQSNKILITRS